MDTLSRLMAELQLVSNVLLLTVDNTNNLTDVHIKIEQYHTMTDALEAIKLIFDADFETCSDQMYVAYNKDNCVVYLHISDVYKDIIEGRVVVIDNTALRLFGKDTQIKFCHGELTENAVFYYSDHM